MPDGRDSLMNVAARQVGKAGPVREVILAMWLELNTPVGIIKIMPQPFLQR
jgi:hypothetical protein